MKTKEEIKLEMIASINIDVTYHTEKLAEANYKLEILNGK